MKRKLFLIIFLSFTLFLIAGVTNSFAFCVYNKTDATLQVTEYSGGSAFGNFDEKLDSGQKKCCNWKNHSCNTRGKRDSIVKFSVNLYTGGWKTSNTNICNIGIKAGGDLVVEGKKGNYRCIPHDY